MKINIKKELICHIFLIAAVIISLWPVVFMLSASFKELNQIFQSPLNPLPSSPTLENYMTVLGRFPIFDFIWNTFFIAFFVTFFASPRFRG